MDGGDFIIIKFTAENGRSSAPGLCNGWIICRAHSRAIAPARCLRPVDGLERYAIVPDFLQKIMKKY
jgi:hypothetical protein